VPVYDTATVEAPPGVHVHARKTPNSDDKEIDHTYRKVKLIVNGTNAPVVISECEAVYHMVSRVFGFTSKYVTCTLCGYPHLDKDWFSVHEHQTHLCAGCGRHFRDTERRIGNPIAKAIELLNSRKMGIGPSGKKLEFRQSQFKGGIQLWGSNPAIVWTADRTEEEGIHLHAYDDEGRIAKDDTYSELVIDGDALDATMIRTLMAQNALPHIAGRVVSMSCPTCLHPHFDSGEEAFTPHDWHVCYSCGQEFQTRGRYRKTICNPAVETLAKLQPSAPRPRRIHETTMLVEALSVG
jgi:transposase-like protein